MGCFQMANQFRREFRGEERGDLVPDLRRRLEVDFHRVHGFGRLDAGFDLVLFKSGICALGPLASAASTSGLSR